MRKISSPSKYSLIIYILLMSKIALAQSSVQSHFGSEDFYIKTVDKAHYEKTYNLKTSGKSAMNCREHIQQVVCLVDPEIEGSQEKPRLCLPGSENYAHFFESLYDLYPAALQKIFCSLNVIYIEKKTTATASAGIVNDKLGNMIGAEMRVRQSIIDENLNLQTWASWKEQLSFGGILDSYTISKGLPQIGTESNPLVNDLLYFVVGHEFGHIFDFANKLNHIICLQLKEGEWVSKCEIAEDSWGAISWVANNKPRAENEFVNRSGLCFYWCEGNFIAASDINKFYSDLYMTDFISAYATRQPFDDFADSLAYYLVNQNLGTRYVIDTAQGISLDIMVKVTSPMWSRKFNYIKSFLERTDIVYP